MRRRRWPVVVVVLARMGLVSVEKLRDFRQYFIVLAFVIAAVITGMGTLYRLTTPQQTILGLEREVAT